MGEWQPIETAPMDGTKFLGYHEKLKNCPHGIWWRQQHSLTTKDGGPVWCLFGVGELYGTPRLEPTHWMPLPDPPSRAGQPSPDKTRNGDNYEKL